MNLEMWIRENAISGVLTDISSPTTTDDPCEGRNWGAGRQVHADLIREILTQQNASGKRATSLRIKGARIVGPLHLDSAEILCPLVLDSCYLEQVQLSDAKTGLLDFHNSCIADGVNANGLRCISNLILTDCQTGPVILTSAWIDGSVGCDGAQISERTGDNSTGYSLVADGVVIQRGLFLRGCRASRIRLMGARISGNFECSGAKLKLRGVPVSTPVAFHHVVLSLDGAQIEGNAFLSEGFHATGAIFMRNVRLGGLACNGGRFETPVGRSIEMDGADIQHDVNWNDVRIDDGASCLGIRIGGSWQCSGACVTAIRSMALMADGARIGNAMFLNKGFCAIGEVRLLGVQITQSLDCDGGCFQPTAQPGFGKALSLDGAQIGGGVFFRDGFHAEGEVRLRGVSVGGPLQCIGGEFKSAAAVTSTANTTGGHYLSEGQIGTAWAGEMCQRTAVSNLADSALDLSFATVAQQIEIRDTVFVGGVTLAHAKAARWHFDPEEYKDIAIDIVGFTYESLTQKVSPPRIKVSSWIHWLNDHDLLSPQPYQQLAFALRTMGHVGEAQDVVIGGRQALRKSLSMPGRIWDRVLCVLIGYGYRRWRPFGCLAGVFCIGWFVFCVGARNGVMVPTQHRAYVSYTTTKTLPRGYPRFEPYLYSLGETLPVTTTRQTAEWRVRGSGVIEAWNLIQRLASGFFWLLGAAGLTGLIRKED